MPYGVDKKIGGDSKTNDSFMEKCVAGISGKNKRTGKPYTKGEKIAICKSSLKKSKSQLVEDDFELSQESTDVENKMAECAKKMMSSGKARDMHEAEMLCEAMLAKSNFDIDQLHFVLTKVL